MKKITIQEINYIKDRTDKILWSVLKKNKACYKYCYNLYFHYTLIMSHKDIKDDVKSVIKEAFNNAPFPINIYDAFGWKLSPEGYDYWGKIAREWDKLKYLK